MRVLRARETRAFFVFHFVSENDHSEVTRGSNSEIHMCVEEKSFVKRGAQGELLKDVAATVDTEGALFESAGRRFHFRKIGIREKLETIAEVNGLGG